MLKSFTFWLSVVAVLITYLCVGKAFDASTIAPQIRQVRQDPLAVLKARGHPNSYRTRLLAVARRIIGGLPFFSRERPEHETQNHNA